MCGICGFVGPATGHIDVSAGRMMTEVLRHRGPDGHGEAEIRAADVDPQLEGWLGHRRLKIIDLTEAAYQPMRNEDGSVVVTYNGEIYNFRELRRDLEAAGHGFRSSGDTEVIVHAYEEWGEGCVPRLDGMFAFALWDARRGVLLLARDRTGKKPLYYTTFGDRLTFASEIKSLLCAPWVDPRPDPSLLPEYLTFGYVPHPRTMFEGIVQVPPACVVTYGVDGLSPPRPYWDPLPLEDQRGFGPNHGHHIAELLEHATRRRLVSDVPLGALLSGGIDSSLVVGLMSRSLSEPVRTFSIGFRDDKTFDERPYARLVADHFRTAHTEFDVEVDAVALMDRLLWYHDQPYADSSAIPTYLVCQLAREHVTVALNGDGGDEIFGGYDRFAAASISERLPDILSRIARHSVRFLPVGHTYHNIRRRAERFLEASTMPVHQRYQAWIAVLNDDLLHEILTVPTRTMLDEPVTRSMDASYEEASGFPVLDQILYANFKTYLPDDLAVKMDRMAMANSLETRSPFLDTELIEYMARVPAHTKVGLRKLKPLLRQAFAPMLPDAIWNRKKHGFGVPMNQWFMGELGTMFADEVIAPDARSAAFLRTDVVRRLWDEHQSGNRANGPILWTLLTLERWLRAVERPQSINPPTTEVMNI
jgi:asparagine synthase (glutamine-hydrolysing)